MKKILVKIVATVLLLFFMSTSPSAADIISTKIRSHNRDTILFSDTFVFSHAGYVSVAVSSVGISLIPVTSNLSKLPDPSRIGFFLVSHKLPYQFEDEFERNPDLCPLDFKFISVLFTFQNLSLPPNNNSSFNSSYSTVTYPGMYSLYLANCNDLSMDVRTELYNTDDDGTTKDYISADQLQPSVYFTFFLIYLCFLGFWIYVSFKNQHCAEMIHLLMGVLLVMSMFHFIATVADQHDLKVTGTHHRGWRVVFYISHFMRDMHFFTVILLIGAGWCNWRKFLPRALIFSMTCVILLQVYATVTFVRVGESGPYNEKLMDFRARFTSIDYMCCLFVGYHTVLSLLLFRYATDTSTFVRSYTLLNDVTARHHACVPYLAFSIHYDDQRTESRAAHYCNTRNHHSCVLFGDVLYVQVVCFLP